MKDRDGQPSRQSPPTKAADGAGTAGAVQAEGRQAAWRRAAAERQTRWFTAQEATLPERAVSGPRGTAHRRRRRQPAPPLCVPGDPRSNADDSPAREFPYRARQHPALSHPSDRRGRARAGAGVGDAGISDLGRQAPQRGDQQRQAGAAPKRERVSRSLLCRDHHVAHASAPHAILRAD